MPRPLAPSSSSAHNEPAQRAKEVKRAAHLHGRAQQTHGLSFLKLWNSSVRSDEVRRVALEFGGARMLKASGEERAVLRSAAARALSSTEEACPGRRRIRHGLREALHKRLRDVWSWCDTVERRRPDADAHKVQSLRGRLFQLSGSSTCLSHRDPADFVLGDDGGYIGDVAGGGAAARGAPSDAAARSGGSPLGGGRSASDPSTKRGREEEPNEGEGGGRKKARLASADAASFDEQGGEEGVFDLNEHCCRRCGGAGELICCDSCPASFHLACAGLYSGGMPNGKWSCRACRKRTSTRSWACSDADLVAMGILAA